MKEIFPNLFPSRLKFITKSPDMTRRLTISILLLCTFLCVNAPGHAANHTLTAGGEVYAAPDGTTGDNAAWQVYSPGDSSSVVSGYVGEYSAGYWAGEIGAPLQNLTINDELVVIIEQEVDAGTTSHKGYFGVVDHTLNNNDPALFNPATLREIPVPNAVTSGTNADISWNEATGESSGTNIVGYHIYRSADGINFSRLNVVPLTETHYSDVNVPAGSYYAISLVYRGTPSIDGQVLSESSNAVGILIGDVNSDDTVDLGDAIIALQVMAGIPVSSPVSKASDVNGDRQIGLPEAIHALRVTSGLIPQP